MQRRTDTNSSDDSEGTVWGLEGNLFVPVIASALISILIATIMFTLIETSIWITLGISIIPFGGTLAFSLAFVQGKPKGYFFDLLDNIITHGEASYTHHNQPKND